MNDYAQTLIRAAAKYGAGILLAHGIIKNSDTEAAVSIGTMVLATLWGAFHQWQHRADKAQQALPKLDQLKG